MDISAETKDVAPAPPTPLFTLDLAGNGGTLSPRNLGELHNWIEVERQFWSWVGSVSPGDHRNAIDAGVSCLHSAIDHIQNALRYGGSSPNSVQEQIGQAQNYLRDAFINKGLPHSSSALGKRIEANRQRDSVEAVAYLFVFLPPLGYQFEARDISSWRVSVLALVGVLGVWAVRLVVRIFLGNIHLASDAPERVTMVKTHLSLLEGEKLPSKDDRKLILQALFRPASDGIVKDEGLPNLALEAVTRIGR